MCALLCLMCFFLVIRWKLKKTPVVCIAIAIVALIIAVANLVFFISVARYSSSVKDGQLGIASDVIQCARPHWTHFLSTMVLSENATDYLNDNPNGLPMSVFSLNSRDIKFHTLVDENPDFELVLPANGTSRFIMPSNYYNRPWYLWKNSTIRVSVDIIFTEEPVEAFMYLFKGEEAIHTFYSNDPLKSSSYEEKVDLISLNSKTILWTAKNNDYYFIGVRIDGSLGTVFQSNITFTILYIDMEDYTWLLNSTEYLRDLQSHLSLGWSGSSNITLCYMHLVDPKSLESSSIHIDVSYRAQWGFVLPITVIPVAFLLLLHIAVAFLFGTWKIRKVKTTTSGYISVS